MAPNTTSLDASHIRSYAILEAARLKLSKEKKYDSKAYRTLVSDSLEHKLGLPARSWQVDATEATHLGLDCIVIAGTGTGKTMPFMMPLLVDPKKKAIIISPLKLLQQDHAERFRKLGVSAAAVNGDTWNGGLQKNLEAGLFQGILASPEMCLKHPEFRRMLTESNFEGISAVYIDEAHCIAQWGGDFRTTYSELGKLRAFFPPHIPFYATSATLPKDALTDVRASLGIDASSCFYLNLGNDRPNLAYEVHKMKSAKAYEAIKPHLTRPTKPSTSNDIYKSIVFTNSVLDTQIAARHIRSWLPKHLREHVAYLHAHRSPRDKRRVMRRFRRGRIKILIATEAAGMGADIPDIEQVIQFGAPSSLSVWIQRAGRAGRSPDINTCAILLAEESVWQKRKKGRNKKSKSADSPASENVDEGEEEDEDDSVGLAEGSALDDASLEWVKKVDPPLRNWILTTECRRDVTDEYFSNPQRQPPTGACCDNCSHPPMRLDDQSRPSTPRPALPLHSAPASGDNDSNNDTTPSSIHSTPSKTANANGKRTMVSSEALTAASELLLTASLAIQSGRPVSNRREEHRNRARHALENWRLKTVETRYNDSFTPSCFLPDSILTALALHRYITSVAKLKDDVRWMYADRHGQEVLEVLAKVDKQVEDERIERREQQKAVTAARNEEKKRQAAAVRQAEKERKAQEKAKAAAEALRQKELKKQMKENQKPSKRPRRPQLAGCLRIDLGQQPQPPMPLVTQPLNDPQSCVHPAGLPIAPLNPPLPASPRNPPRPRPRPRPLLPRPLPLHTLSDVFVGPLNPQVSCYLPPIPPGPSDVSFLPPTLLSDPTVPAPSLSEPDPELYRSSVDRSNER